jgi:hypothetical protein
MAVELSELSCYWNNKIKEGELMDTYYALGTVSVRIPGKEKPRCSLEDKLKMNCKLYDVGLWNRIICRSVSTGFPKRLHFL